MRLLPRRLRKWTVLRRLTAAAFFCLLILGSLTWFPWFRGTTSATSAFDTVPFVDPLAALEAALASRQLHWTALIGAAILLAAASLLGPIFCGWVCPLGLLLDLNQSVRRRLPRLLGRQRPVGDERPLPDLRYAALAFFACLSLAGSLPVFQLVSPINLLVRAVVFSPDLGLLAVAGIVLLEYRWPRLWCRSFCPLGAVYGLIGARGLFRVRIGQTREVTCGLCSRQCPMGIRVTEDYVAAGRSSIIHPRCNRCGECTDHCPGDVLVLGLRAPRR
ncbi:MAG: 4Fe-4S binding protein [Phycisphaerales bacterium JB038]